MYSNNGNIVFESGFAVCNRDISFDDAVTNRETHLLYYILYKIGQQPDNHYIL